jgi:formyltetrahydrofolate dehydrogenase
MDIVCPIQSFINGQFCDSESGQVMDTVDPNTEQVICQVPQCTAKDIDRAVHVADEAFYYGEWSRISPRERGRLMYKLGKTKARIVVQLFFLADLMDQHREELATIESIDSGAVYTLALKTHVGMSIDVWRYYAGWCDKIQASCHCGYN